MKPLLQSVFPVSAFPRQIVFPFSYVCECAPANICFHSLFSLGSLFFIFCLQFILLPQCKMCLCASASETLCVFHVCSILYLACLALPAGCGPPRHRPEENPQNADTNDVLSPVPGRAQLMRHLPLLLPILLLFLAQMLQQQHSHLSLLRRHLGPAAWQQQQNANYYSARSLYPKKKESKLRTAEKISEFKEFKDIKTFY